MVWDPLEMELQSQISTTAGEVHKASAHAPDRTRAPHGPTPTTTAFPGFNKQMSETDEIGDWGKKPRSLTAYEQRSRDENARRACGG